MKLLDLRSFSSVWYWLALLSAWTVVGRGILGVPGEVLHRARAAMRPDGDTGAGDPVPAVAPAEGLLLLDWLSLTLPRWHVPPLDGAILAGTGAFVMTSLGVLGFGYGLELAQAVFLLAAPLAVLLLLRVRLAHRLLPVLADAHAGRVPPATAAGTAAAAMVRHRLQGMVLSMLAVAAAATWGTWWVIVHPYGF